MSSRRSSSTSLKQRDHFAMELRPRMLKDFLIEESNSCSSSGFKTFPRRVDDQDRDSVRNLSQTDLNYSNSYSTSSNARRGSTLQRSRSRAATVTISAFQAFINSVKSIQFITAAAKSPSILPRSLSLRLSKKKSHHAQNNTDQVKTFTTVKIKDIIRWKSFRDLVMEEEEQQEEKPQPSDHLQNTNTTTTASSIWYSTNTSCSSSNGSSWCDSDFSSENLPSWFENDDVEEVGKKFSPSSSCSVGRGSMEATTESPTPATSAVGPKDGLACDEKEQRSPLSVLELDHFDDDQFEEDEEDSVSSSFDRSLANVERTKQKLMQNIRRFESLAKIDPIDLDKWISMEENGGCEEEEEDDDDDYNEEEIDDDDDEVEHKARILLNRVKATTTTSTSMVNCNKKDSNVVEQVLLDFFIEELMSTMRDQTRNDSELVRVAKSWINGGQTEGTEMEACVKEMGRWSKFDEEQQEMGLQIENVLLNLLLDELLSDLLLG